MPACTEVLGAGTLYDQYYSGQYFIENTDNPGNDDPVGQPPIYTSLPGNLTMCEAAELCATTAMESWDGYFSFDLHYLCSNNTWECVDYYDYNTDASYFNVPDPDAVFVVGFSAGYYNSSTPSG